MRIYLPVFACLLAFSATAQKAKLQLHYDFNSKSEIVKDQSGNNYDAVLKNDAFADKVDKYGILNLGTSNGYLDMGAGVGALIGSLTDFTVSAYIAVDESANLGSNGNFVWTFANSADMVADGNGCMFYSAKSQRYAITKTNYSAESGMQVGRPLEKRQWQRVTYTQKGNLGTLYVNGEVVKSESITISPQALGKTTSNFIGRSCYSADAYFKGLIADFRIYDQALSASDVAKLSKDVEKMNAAFQDYFNQPKTYVADQNPLFSHKYTADPAALVHDGTFYIYAGEDTGEGRGYNMPNWVVFGSKDLKTWTEYPVPFSPKDFSWAIGNTSWAAQVIERNGKFYWYITTEHASIHGKSIGVAVSDSPTGPFKDARGSALITNNMTTEYTGISWDDIDPTVWIDDDGQAYIFWGNTQCYYAKLKDNMIELDSEIMTVDLPRFTEAPWIHKNGDWYYLSYAYQFPEKTAYARSKSIEGPWEFMGLLNELSGNSNTNHQAIVKFEGKWYFVYHNGGLPGGGSFLRSVCIDYLYHNEDGSIKRIQMTSEGIFD